MVILCSVELFVGDVLYGGDVVVLCSYLLYNRSICFLLICYRLVVWSSCVITWFTADGAACW